MGGAHGSREPRRLLAGLGAAAAGVAAGVLVVALVGDGLSVPWPGGDDPVPAAGQTLPADAPSPSPAASVLPAAPAPTDVTLPTAAGLRTALSPALRARELGPRVGVVVVDPATGASVYTDRGDLPHVPASTAKLLTAASALTLLGDDATLRTRVVAGRTPDEVVLVGGGDPTLTRDGTSAVTAPGGASSLEGLADQTAKALAAAGTTSVRLVLDDTLFTGPRTGPGWLPADVERGVATRVSALKLDTDPATRADRPTVTDPTGSAGRAFGQELGSRGITVTSTVRAAAPPDAEQLAVVTSPSVGALVEHMLLQSDNDYAETLGHLAGLAAGTGGSFSGGVAAAQQTLDRLGIETAGVRLVDASGLSTRNQVPPSVLGAVLAAATRGDRPELAAVLTGLPVAGVVGSLATRFDTTGTEPGRGLVRAKTGTLTGINSLAGTVVDADGRLMVFAVLADRTSPDTLAVRAALDRVATALTTCGCA